MASEWRDRPLEEICAFLNRGAAPSYVDREGLMVLNQKCVRDGRVLLDQARRTDPAVKRISKERVLKPFDVLVNSTGVGTLGRVAQVLTLPEAATVDSHITIVRADPQKVFPRYLGFALRKYQPEIEALAEGSTGQTELSRARLAKLRIALPPPLEQQAIACILGALDDKIELNRRMNRTLEDTARAIFKSWFVDFDPVRAKASGQKPPGLKPETAALFPNAFEDSGLGEIPRGWRVGQLGEIIDIHDSNRIPLSSRERQKRQGSYRYYGAAGIVDYVDDFLFDGIYVLVGEDGSVVTMACNPVVQYVWGKFWVNNHAHVLKAKGGVTDEHLLLLLQQVYVTPFVTGAVQPKLSQTNMKAIPVIHGSSEVNKEFGRVINPLYAKQRVLHDQIGSLVAVRDALLPKLISGDLVIAEAERIVERCT